MIKVEMQVPQINNYRMIEGLNQLKINLSFCGKDINTIMIISTVAGEGKSSVAFNLAQTLSENEKKTVLVDCDLRKSAMAVKYHMQKIDKGLSHYLSGQAEFDDIVYSTENPKLFLVPSGPHILDPTNLLDTDIFKEFMKSLREQYDYIIIDTPPLGMVMDAVIVGQCADGAVLVIEQGKIKRKMAQNVVKQLKRSDIRVLGAVLNKVDERMSKYQGYSYNYSDNKNWK